MSGIKLTNVSKSFGSLKVIHGVDIEIAQGEFAVFVGPSGCGIGPNLSGIPCTSATSGFGQITTTVNEPRNIQLALKFVF